jgi:hypothetical protein
MNTCCETSPTSPSAVPPPAKPSYFSRLRRLVGGLRFYSVDLVDNIVEAMPPNRDTGVPHLNREGAEKPRLMPLRLI